MRYAGIVAGSSIVVKGKIYIGIALLGMVSVEIVGAGGDGGALATSKYADESKLSTTRVKVKNASFYFSDDGAQFLILISEEGQTFILELVDSMPFVRNGYEVLIDVDYFTETKHKVPFYKKYPEAKFATNLKIESFSITVDGLEKRIEPE